MGRWRLRLPGLLLLALPACPVQATLDLPCETSDDCPRRWACVNQVCQAADAGPEDIVLGDAGPGDRTVAGDRSSGDRATGTDQRRVDSAQPPDAVRRDTAVRTDSAPRTDSARADTAVRRDSATAPDARTGDAGCGAITFIGQCQGDVARWCEDSALKVVNCSTSYGGATCGLYDCAQEGVDGNGDPLCYGYWCVARLNQACNTAPGYLGCDITLNHGCFGDVCTPTASCDPVNDPTSCSANRVSFCPYGRLWDYDCSQGGTQPYQCGTTSGGYSDCLGTAGGRCNTAVSPPSECVSGLTCTNNICG